MAGVRSFEELHCWQRAHELKVGIYALIRSGRIRDDVDFRDQIRDAAAGGPRLIAEGFGRYLPTEFIKYLRWANGEVHETSNHLRDGFDQGYFPKPEVERLVRVAKRASRAIAGLIRYLETCPDPRKRSSKPKRNSSRNPHRRNRTNPTNSNPMNPNPTNPNPTNPNPTNPNPTNPNPNPMNPMNPMNPNPLNPLQPNEPDEPND
jgi:four helix bundle protein